MSASLSLVPAVLTSNRRPLVLIDSFAGLPVDDAAVAGAHERVTETDRSARLHDIAQIEVRSVAPRPDVPDRHRLMRRKADRKQRVHARDVFRSVVLRRREAADVIITKRQVEVDWIPSDKTRGGKRLRRPGAVVM